MKGLFLIPIILMLLLTSCEESKKEESNQNTTSEVKKENPNKKEFEAFVANFKEAKLPLVFSSDDSNFVFADELDMEKYPNYYSVAWPHVPYGYVKLKDGKIALVIFYMADWSPMVGIQTFTRDGKLIDIQEITSGGDCGPDPCFTCTQITTINTDLTTKYESEGFYTDCENDNNTVTDHFKNHQEGRILSNGKIEIGKKIEKQLVGKISP